MTADKRTPHTDALETLGMIHQHDEKRDAIHLGVEPVLAGETLYPSQHIGLIDGKAYSSEYRDIKLLGIVDPFLTKPIKEGQKFWLVVYPRQITSLRHVWEHPNFPDSRETGHVEKENSHERSEAEIWLRGYADDLDINFDELISYGVANAQRRPGSWEDYLCDGGKLEGESTSNEFWEQLSVYMDIKIPEENKTNFFTCSC